MVAFDLRVLLLVACLFEGLTCLLILAFGFHFWGHLCEKKKKSYFVISSVQDQGSSYVDLGKHNQKCSSE